MASRNRAIGLQLLAALLGLRLFSVTFVSPRGGNFARRGQVALNVDLQPPEGEEDNKDEEGGFMKFLKVEQDIELSPEEYNIALEQEMDGQRKKYYIGGKIDPKNLVVPWKPVDEKAVRKDAVRQLRKNGIKDPAGGDVPQGEEDSEIELLLLNDDVQITWIGGSPGKKVGYIVERKRKGDSNFLEIGTYDNMKNPQLLVKQFTGHEYFFKDELLQPGEYTYRVLCRVRSGDLSVVDEKDVVVQELAGLDNKLAFGLLGLAVLASAVYGFSTSPGITYD
jgi:hypothetical protein